MANDTGIEDSPITVSIETNGNNGSFTVNANNTITFTPNNGFIGSEIATYRITDVDGDYSSATITVSITEPIIIPDGFSPDDDGIGDTFTITGIENYPNNELFIYNRWGTLVYSKKNYNNEWDGRSNSSNEKLPVGTYFYVLTIKGESNQYKGFVYLKY